MPFSNALFVPGDRSDVVTANFQNFDNQKTSGAHLALSH